MQVNERTAELEAAVRAQDALIAQAQAEITRYLTKEIESAELVDSLLKLLDRPQQREAQRLVGAGRGFRQQRMTNWPPAEAGPISPDMVRIGISQAAFDAIAFTMPYGSVGYWAAAKDKGERLV